MLSSKLLTGACVAAAAVAAAATASDEHTALRRLDTLSVDETTALIASWGLEPYFGRSFQRLSVDGELLQHLDSDDLLGPESGAAFPEAHSMHKKKLLRKLAQLEVAEADGATRLVDPSLLLNLPHPAVSVDASGAVTQGLLEEAEQKGQQHPGRGLLADDGSCDADTLSDYSGLHVKQACASVALGSAMDVRLTRNDTGVGVLKATNELHLDAPVVYTGSPSSKVVTEGDLESAGYATSANLREELTEVELSLNNALAGIQTDMEQDDERVDAIEANVALLFEEMYTLAAMVSNNSDALLFDVCASNPCQNGATCVLAGKTDFTCLCANDWEGELCDSLTASSCNHLYLNGITEDGLYEADVCGDGVLQTVSCRFDTDKGVGWTLLGSFVNTDDSLSWAQGDGLDNWLTDTTFGDVNDYLSADYKSASYNCMPISDILVSDNYGWVSFDEAIEDGSGDAMTMLSFMTSFDTCQTVPLVFPGSSTVDSSAQNYKDGAMLAVFSVDPNGDFESGADNCPLNEPTADSDSSVLCLSGAACGTMGLGQWETNYAEGMDWHLRIDDETTCIGCDDGCGLGFAGWYGVDTVTSATHNNNEGLHDESTWGLLWAK